MPRVVDKIIINGARTEGTHQAIMAEYASLKTMADEITANGWIGATDPLKIQMKLACDAHDAADLAYLKALRDLVQAVSDFIDGPHP